MSETQHSTGLELTSVQTWLDFSLSDADRQHFDATASEILDELLLRTTLTDLYCGLKIARRFLPPENHDGFAGFLYKVGTFVSSSVDLYSSPVQKLHELGRSARRDPILVFAAKIAATRYEQEQAGAAAGADMMRSIEANIASTIRGTVRTVCALPLHSST